MRSFSNNTSIHSISDQPHYEPTNAALFLQLSKKLQECSQCLTFSQFTPVFKNLIKKCIRKAEVDSSFTDVIPHIRKWISLYSYDMQILARLLILESAFISKQLAAESFEKLNKVKHLLIDTDFEYLLTKVFVVESKVHEMTNQKQAKLRCLKKCIEYGENYALQYLKEPDQIRHEIADNMIIAYFEVFKLMKQTKPNKSIEYLSKCYQAALKNYGPEHFSTVSISSVLNQQKTIFSSMQKLEPKALSIIQSTNIKKNTVLNIMYSWQEQLLVIQIHKTKGEQRRNLAEATVSAKLNTEKLKLLKQKNYLDWMQIINNGSNLDIRVYEDELRKIIEDNLQNNAISANSQAFKPVEKSDIFKRNQEPLSSSSDDQDIIVPENDRFLKFYRGDRSHINVSRSKSRDHQNSRH